MYIYIYIHIIDIITSGNFNGISISIQNRIFPILHFVKSLVSSRNPRLIMTDAEAPEMTHLGWSVELSFLVLFFGGRKKHLLPKDNLGKDGGGNNKNLENLITRTLNLQKKAL